MTKKSVDVFQSVSTMSAEDVSRRWFNTTLASIENNGYLAASLVQGPSDISKMARCIDSLNAKLEHAKAKVRAKQRSEEGEEEKENLVEAKTHSCLSATNLRVSPPEFDTESLAVSSADSVSTLAVYRLQPEFLISRAIKRNPKTLIMMFAGYEGKVLPKTTYSQNGKWTATTIFGAARCMATNWTKKQAERETLEAVCKHYKGKLMAQRKLIQRLGTHVPL